MCIDWVLKIRLDKTTRCLSLWGQNKPAGIKLQYFCQHGDKKKNIKKNQRTKLSIYILDTIESESTTRFKNRSSDRMMTFDRLVDVSDDRCTTSQYYPSVHILKFFQIFYCKTIHPNGMWTILSTTCVWFVVFSINKTDHYNINRIEFLTEVSNTLYIL